MPQPLERAARATDRPLTDPNHDHFQRAPFAKRIAETLISRQSSDSIVVGLYGKWGEGKSTVLNFIRQSLAEAPDTVAVLNFNPWRFSDETQLLVNFFGELATIIGQNLLNDKQRALKGFGSYVVPLIPSLSLGPVSADVSKSLEGLLKMAQPEVDEQRARIEQLIVESGKRVVVIIDDIDRLEKTQIQAVFRLVKLTADFKQTAYLLAFDDAMVARAIGEVFASDTEGEAGSRTLLAGQNFLEKIIQVPLRLPPARADALLDFCYKRVDEALLEVGSKITDTEG
ncbi:KAP family P-loop NTPase fold protein [Hymenobacter arizonensis]|uniref:KAP family P-loop NTPase fold protein n=1 Tax=Hymenobacter arizonensis TaxID=1227077 RepID=UPI000A791995|nr:KAP family NTPase [Hymenobacter arizonensis]